MMNKSIATLLSATFLLAGCDPEASGNSGAEVDFRADERLDGRALFAGIFFGQGAVADRLPAAWGKASNDERMALLSRVSPETMLRELDRAIERTDDRRMIPVLEEARERIAAGDTIEGDLADLEIVMDLVERQDPTYFDRLERAVHSGDRPAIQKVVHQGFLFLKGLLTVENSVIEIGTEEGNAVAFVFVAVAVIAYVAVAIEVLRPGIEESLIQEEMLVDEIAQQLGGFQGRY